MKKINLIYSLFILAFTCLVGCTVWLLTEHHPVGALYTALGALCVIVALFYLINRHFRIFRRLLLSIGDEEFSSLGFPQNAFSELFAHELNRALKQYKKREAANITLRLSYETLLDKTDTAFLMVLPDGHVDWMNKAALLSLGNIPDLNSLDALCKGFTQAVEQCKVSETFVVAFYRNDLPYNMAVSVSQLNDRRIVTLQNIHSVLEANELVAWQRLISVLTHEIMNSLTPIISLSDTLMDRIQGEGERKAIETIRRRSAGLQAFVENYRTITRVPLPVKAPFMLDVFLEQITTLFPEGTLSYAADRCHLRLMADQNQMEQVFLNLVKNAIEADAPIPIEVEAFVHPLSGNTIITVKDKGRGIPADVIDQIFIPFFSTKPSGSGIGLSLCKQIISLHGGSLSASSGPQGGTCFRISLPSA